MNQQEIEERSFGYDPLEGDEGDRVWLSDKFVNKRKPATCNICGEVIKPGDRCRVLTDKFDGEIGSYHYCLLCVSAMVEALDGEEDAITARYTLGYTPAADAGEGRG